MNKFRLVLALACGLVGTPALAQDNAAAHYVDAHSALWNETPGGYANGGLNYGPAVTQDIDGTWIPMSVLLGSVVMKLGAPPDEEAAINAVDRFCASERAHVEIRAEGDYVFIVVRGPVTTTYRSVSAGLFAVSHDVPATFEWMGLEDPELAQQRVSTLMTLPREVLVTRPYPDILTIRKLGLAPEIFLRCTAG